MSSDAGTTSTAITGMPAVSTQWCNTASKLNELLYSKFPDEKQNTCFHSGNFSMFSTCCPTGIYTTYRQSPFFVSPRSLSLLVTPYALIQKKRLFKSSINHIVIIVLFIDTIHNIGQLLFHGLIQSAFFEHFL